jgi:D-arginine dehydrogenase
VRDQPARGGDSALGSDSALVVTTSMDVVEADFLIVGGGIAGTSVGYFLAPKGRTVVLERESQPGYHSTGRSAAMLIDSYGPRQVRSLTAASREFFERPPSGFVETNLLSPRAVMSVGRPEQESLLDEHFAEVQSATARVQRLTGREACELMPVLRPEQLVGAVLDSTAADLDVHALHQGFLRGIRREGGLLQCDAEVLAIARQAGIWSVSTRTNTYRSPILINAAGAWCDHVAGLAGAKPIGLTPKRRSAFLFSPPHGVRTNHWPMCAAVDETWYFKPDAGVLLGSPANTDAAEPHDVQPEEYDIALGIHRIEEMTTLQITRPSRIWAGLRSFTADGGLVGGYAPETEGFFWVAGQGGYGIQTSAAMGAACAALIVGQPLPAWISHLGVTREMLEPARLAEIPPR